MCLALVGSILTRSYIRYNEARKQRQQQEALFRAETLLNAGKYRDAVPIYQDLLLRLTPEKTPVLYGDIQRKLATCHLTLAQSEDAATHLKAGAMALEKALGIVDAATAEYAKLQQDLGAAYSKLALFRNPGENYPRAIRANQEALKTYTLKHHPDTYARLHKAIGMAYRNLAEVTDSRENLSRAKGVFEAALTVYTLNYDPFEHGVAQNNIGAILMSLAAGDEQEIYLKTAVHAFEAARTGFNPKVYPFDYALAMNNMGLVYNNLSVVTKSDKYLDLAINAFQAARETIPPESHLKFQRIIQANLDQALARREQMSLQNSH